MATAKNIFLPEFLTKMLAEHRIKQIEGSWAFQDRLEKRRRMAAVLELAAELQRIKQTSTYATAIYGHTPIEAIIEGNWKEARSVLDWMAESAEWKEHCMPLWGTFREILRRVTSDA